MDTGILDQLEQELFLRKWTTGMVEREETLNGAEGRGKLLLLATVEKERQKAVQTRGWALSLSGSVPVELVWCEMEIEATDPNSTKLLRPYLQEKSKDLSADLPEQQINTELRISRAVIHAKGSCVDEGMKSAQVHRFSI
ncbi:unnamed protein product [Bubo scandiacus]